MVAELGHSRHAESTGRVGCRRLTIDDDLLKMVLRAIDSNRGMTANQPVDMVVADHSLTINVALRYRPQIF